MSLLDQITPVLLTWNEAPNIARTLSRLSWARTVCVVDSYSSDATTRLVRDFPNARIVQRRFDNHASQWNFGLEQVPPETPWVLALDADYILTPEFLKELSGLDPDEGVSGYMCRFTYAVCGRPIRSGVYPAKIVLFRRARGHFVQDGHTQRAIVEGRCGAISAALLHDDRKPLDRWIASQLNYARLESEALQARTAEGGKPGLRDWLRTRTPFGPLAVAIYCLFVRGGLFEGLPGWTYALQRMAAEALISATFLDSRLNARVDAPAPLRDTDR